MRGGSIFRLSVYRNWISFSFSQYTGGQCPSYETLDNIVGNCQRLVINSSAVEHWFTLKFDIRYRWYRFRPYHWYRYCGLCRSWCKYLSSCRLQTPGWLWNCIRNFKYYGHFQITTVPRGKDLPLLKIDVNLCKTIFYRYSWDGYDKIFTINITEHKSELNNVKNG